MTDSLHQRYEVGERGGIVPTKKVSEILRSRGRRPCRQGKQLRTPAGNLKAWVCCVADNDSQMQVCKSVGKTIKLGKQREMVTSKVLRNGPHCYC